MDMDEILSMFTKSITEVELNKRAAKAIFKREVDLVRKFTKDKQEQEGNCDFYSLSSLCYWNIRTGRLQEYELKEISLEEHIDQIILQKNRQYCWLLAEAYEAFEDYLEHVYAYIGCVDASKWVKRDLRKYSVGHAQGQSYSWFLSNAKRICARDIRKRIGRIYRTVAFHEKKTC